MYPVVSSFDCAKRCSFVLTLVWKARSTVCLNSKLIQSKTCSAGIAENDHLCSSKTKLSRFRRYPCLRCVRSRSLQFHARVNTHHAPLTGEIIGRRSLTNKVEAWLIVSLRTMGSGRDSRCHESICWALKESKA